MWNAVAIISEIIPYLFVVRMNDGWLCYKKIRVKYLLEMILLIKTKMVT